MTKLLSTIGLIVLVMSQLVVAASAWSADAPGRDALSPAVLRTLATLPPSDMTTVIVTLRDQADLDATSGRTERVRAKRVILALRSTADAAQVKIGALLRNRAADGLVADVIPFWVINAMSVTATADVIRELASRSDVASITPDEVKIVPTVGTPEPNLTAAGAPSVWGLGYTGQGVVVASLDSGVDVSHPDLAGRWRGGTNSWFDPYAQHATPTDLTGHGTGVMGAMVGGDAGGTSIGMAPGARWIAARIADDAGGSTATAIHSAFQWLLDPDGNPNTDDAPDIVNNSWSYGAGPGCDLAFQPDLQALRAAGIVPVFAAGNFGPTASTSASPANYPEALAVGGVNNADQPYSASSHGPSACGEASTTFPEIVAPGVSITTSDRFGLYQAVSGTSLSAPHVSGALALLLSSKPGASAAQLEAAVVGTAVDLGAAGPDNTYGNGRLDTLAAYGWLAAQPDPDLVGPTTTSPNLSPNPSDGATSVALQATGDDSGAGGSDIDAAEYFVGTVGADGSGRPMTVGTAGPVSSVDAVISKGILGSLSDGTHAVSIHSRDAAGNWGAPVTIDLVLDRTSPSERLFFSTVGNNTIPGRAGPYDDAHVYRWDGAGFARATSAKGVGLPRSADVDGYDRVNGQRFYMSFDGATTVPGIGKVRDEDVAEFDHGTWSLFFDGSAHGLGSNGALDLDAISIVGDALFFSTTGNAAPPGVGGTADDADIYRWNGRDRFTRAWDATVNGLGGGADVDGYSRIDPTHLYLSFRNPTTTAPGVGTLQDEDVAQVDSGAWSVYFDGTAEGLTGAGRDLDAIDVP